MGCSNTGLEPTSITILDCEGNIPPASITICTIRLQLAPWEFALFVEVSRRVVLGIFSCPCMALVARLGTRLKSVPMLSTLDTPSKLPLPLFSAMEQILKSKLNLEVSLGCEHYIGKMENSLFTMLVKTTKASRCACNEAMLIVQSIW